MYFSNSHESRDLPMPAIPITETSCALPSSAERVEQLLDEPQLAVAADERRLEAGRAHRTPRVPGRHPERPQERHRLRLALQLVVARVLVGDRGLGRALRRLADEHRARLGRRLDRGTPC